MIGRDSIDPKHLRSDCFPNVASHPINGAIDYDEYLRKTERALIVAAVATSIHLIPYPY